MRSGVYSGLDVDDAIAMAGSAAGSNAVKCTLSCFS